MESGIGATAIAKQMGIGRSTVYKLLGEIGE
jgi:DNA invertase Pin-like site-specific DNA recombinase